MYTVSTKFSTLMNKAFRPALENQIEYGQIDINSTETATISGKSTEMNYSNANQVLLERDYTENIKLATCEKNQFLLDGSFSFCNNEAYPDNCIIGYRPNQLTNSVSTISSTATKLKIVCNGNINSSALTIIFSELLNEYAENFTVQVGNTIHTITGNKKIEWVSDFEISGADNITINITKWNKPYTRIKILKVIFGEYIVFSDDNLTSLKVDNKFNPISGQLSESTIDFSFLNISKEYNPMNLNSKQRFITEKQPISYKCGYKGEMYNIGQYQLSGKPEIKDGIVSLNGSNFITKFDFNITAILYENATLYKIIEDIIKLSGIDKYNIDSELKNIVVTTAIEGNAKNILTDALIASKKQIWQLNKVLYIGNKSIEKSGYDISNDNEENPEITTDDVIKNITLTTKTYQLGTTNEVIKKYKPTENGTFTIDIDYCTNVSVTGGTLVSNTINSVTVTGVSGTEIVISGNKLITNALTVTKTDSTISEGKEKQIKDNPFISTVAQANSIIDWLFNYYKNRQIINSKWRQNPSLQVGDVIGIDSDYGNYNIIIEENKFEFKNGGLSGETKGRIV